MAVLVTTTLAPGMKAPLGSLTLPAMFPLVSCVQPIAVRRHRIAISEEMRLSIVAPLTKSLPAPVRVARAIPCRHCGKCPIGLSQMGQLGGGPYAKRTSLSQFEGAFATADRKSTRLNSSHLGI